MVRPRLFLPVLALLAAACVTLPTPEPTPSPVPAGPNGPRSGAAPANGSAAAGPRPEAPISDSPSSGSSTQSFDAIVLPTPEPDPCPDYPIGHFQGCYFPDQGFSQTAYTQDDPAIAFDWGDGAPSENLPPDGFAVRWQGTFDFEDGEYEFLVRADDAVRLTVGSIVVIDAWYGQPTSDHVAFASPGEGAQQVRLEYYDQSGEAAIQLRWMARPDPYFTYAWEAGETLTGAVSLPEAAPRPIVLLAGEPTLTLNSSAALRLADIDVVLVDDEEPWDAASAGLLYEMVRRLPTTRLQLWDAKPWRVSLTNEALPQDVVVNRPSESESTGTIRISAAAFVRSNPTLQPSADGNADRVFYSNRLFNAVLKAFYDDPYLLKEILESRYGVSAALGAPADEFQEFSVEEMRYLAAVLEDLPSGFRSIPGLDQVVRRKNGLTNPTYPDAPAIAWVTLGYIEFMDSAFISGDAQYIQRLIAHEMAHFLWHNVLDDDTQAEFSALSGWSQTASGAALDAASASAVDHPKATGPGLAPGAWYRTTTTNFTSDYAAAINPDEDFAESLSYYVYQPDHMRTIAPAKYAFVNEVVDGYEYVTLVDEQFTFQVFNLEPDLTFPGKIVAIDVTVARSITGENRVDATLHLSPRYGDGAASASARLTSPADTIRDIFFAPLAGDPYTLIASFTLDPSVASGYWRTNQITVRDSADNRRFEGQDQFGWQLSIENPEQDLEAPVADLEGITGEVVEADGAATVVIRVPLSDATSDGLGGYATLQHYASGQSRFVYATHQAGAGHIVFTYDLRSYDASGEWVFREFWASDKAGNQRRYDTGDAALSFTVATAQPDYVVPELDIASIRIEATPRNPEAPDGETDVTIWYQAKDDNAGLGVVSYRLLKPTGASLFDYHYHANFYTSYFVGTANEFIEYRIDLTLPAGSPPGTWALSELVIADKAGNTLTSNFVETGILRTIEVQGDGAV